MAAQMTKAQAAKVKRASDLLYAARIAAEQVLTELDVEGVDFDFDHLDLKNAFTGIEMAEGQFGLIAQLKQQGAV